MNTALAKSPEFTISVVADNTAFAALRPEWQSLNASAASSSFFMSWEWHYTWWQVYSTPQDQLFIVKFMINGALVGLLPLYLRQSGLMRASTMMFLGTGEPEADEVATEYLDVLAAPGFEEVVADAAIYWMAASEHCHQVEFRFLLDDSLILNASRRLPDLLHFEERATGFRYRVDLREEQAGHLEHLPPSRLKRLKRSQKALEKEGGLIQHSVSNSDELASAFSGLIELNHERQEVKQRKSAFASIKFHKFHHQLSQCAFDQGAVNIHQFKLGSSLLAVLYCFYDERNCYYYQSGFSKRSANRYMPLTFAHLAEMRRSRDSGRHYYDFMRAEPPTYKDEYGCKTTAMFNLFAFTSEHHMKLNKVKRSARRNVVSLLGRAGIKRRP